MFIKMGEMSQFNNIYRVCLNVIALIFAIAVATACQKEEQMPQGGFPVKVTTTADNARPLAKTSVNNDLTINWTTGDQLLMVAQTANNVSAATTLSLKEGDAGKNEATFIGTVETEEVPSVCYFAYPATADISTANGTVLFNYNNQNGTHNPFLVSNSVSYSSQGITATLNHIGGVLAVTLPGGITGITIQGNEGETLSGCKYNFGTGEATLEGQTSFTINPASAGTCYINMPPVKFEKGFTLIFSGPDSKKMYKSFNYSTTGGCDFSAAPTSGSADAQHLKGALVEIDASQFVPESVSSTALAQHTYNDDGTLTGSSVTLSGITLQGVPNSLVTNYSAELRKGDATSGTLVRSYSSSSLPQASTSITLTDPTPSGQTPWPYLPQGSYTLIQKVETIYGTTTSTQTVTVGAPTLKATISALTSYSYYLAGEIESANGCDNATIYDITVGAKISEDILTNGNYSSLKPKAQYKIDKGSFSAATDFTTSPTAHNFGKIEGQDWTSHTVVGKVTFDGVTSSETSITVHITGLPYSKNCLDNDLASTGWTIVGDNKFDDGCGQEMQYTYYGNLFGSPIKLGNPRSAKLFTPTFITPTNINVQVSYNVVYTQSVAYNKSIIVYSGPTNSTESHSTTNSFSLSANNSWGESATGNNYNSTLSSNNNMISFYHNNPQHTTSSEYWLYLKSVEIKYR